MTTALSTTTGADLAEQVAIAGDLAKLTPEQRMAYYGEVCRSMGLNPLTRPFEYIVLNDKLTLYARRDATDQLRKIYGVNISIVARETVEGVYVVTARATTAEGRTDESVGAVPLVKEEGEWKTSQNNKRYFQGTGTYRPIGPEDRANAMMKAETKAKRRVTLSVVGLGWLDETELETIPSAKTVQINQSTGEILDANASYTAPLAGGIEELATSVKALRDCERTIGSEPPEFTWNSKKGRAPLANERTASMSRIYAWVLSKADADTVYLVPPLEELDDQGLIDLAIATKGL